MGFPATKIELEQWIAERTRFLRETTDTVDDETVRKRGVALWKLAEGLMRLDRFEEAATRFDEAASMLWPFDSERATAVSARSRQAQSLATLGRNQDAVDVLSEVVGEIGLDWSDPEFPNLMPALLRLWMGLLREVGSVDEAEAVADVVLAWPEVEGTLEQRILRADALISKALAAIGRGSNSEAMVVLDEVIERCSCEGGEQLPEDFRSLLASGLVMRAFVLEQTGRPDEALTAYENVLARYGTASGAGIDNVMSDARDARKRLRAGNRRLWKRR